MIIRYWLFLGNKKGEGSSLNNLSAAELTLGNKIAAEKYIELAIQNAEEMLSNLTTGTADPSEDVREETYRLKRVLSDRRGNLAVIYLQQDRFTDAFAVIEKILADDRENFYIRGLVIKQGILGQFYLSQRELISAERILQSALQFVRRRDENIFNEHWNIDVRSIFTFIPFFYYLLLSY